LANKLTIVNKKGIAKDLRNSSVGELQIEKIENGANISNF